MSAPALDSAFVRAQFPAFAEPSLAGQAFFENAGGSFACAPVIDRLTRFYRARKVQPYAPYAASGEAGAEMDEARSRLSALLGVAPASLSFGPSTTQNTYVLAQAFRRALSPGDAIVVTNQDHEANSGPWRRLGEEGFEIREWAVARDTGHLDPAGLEPLLQDGRVRLVCFPHASNIVGEINPVSQIAGMARAAGAWSCVDGVSYAPHGLPDIGALGADIYLFSAYKTYGPHQGLMILAPELIEALPNQGHHFNAGAPEKRFTPAGPDHAQVAASAGMVDYVEALAGHHGVTPKEVAGLMRDRETALLQPLLDAVSGMGSARLLGPADAGRRVPTVALALERPGEEAAADLARHGIMAGGGDFYAGRVLEAMGVDARRGVLRLSFVHYTTRDEIDRLIEALGAVL